MRKIFQLLLFLIIITLISSLAFVYYYINGINRPLNIIEEKKITIRPGEDFSQISRELYAAGLINSIMYFRIYAWQNGWEGKFKAGEYALSGQMNLRQVAKAIVSGEAIDREVKILIKEGLNTAEIAKIFQQNSMFSSDDFLRIAGYPKVDYSKASNYPALIDYAGKFSFLDEKPKYFGLEGYLFPDTYLFFKDTTPEGAVLKMLGNFDRKLSPALREDIKKQGKTIYEIVTMASLIEKEVKSKEDMKMVSGIFWNRIANRQRLESCASLAYILGVNKSQYSQADTEIDSPYNTYRNYDLPPGPIANPGLNAIIAAIYPADTDYNYFLTADDGHTVFSKTFDEHIKNKQIYLK